jgi:hypothetical protein
MTASSACLHLYAQQKHQQKLNDWLVSVWVYQFLGPARAFAPDSSAADAISCFSGQ